MMSNISNTMHAFFLCTKYTVAFNCNAVNVAMNAKTCVCPDFIV